MGRNGRTTIRAAALLALLTVSYGAGVATGLYRIPPFPQLLIVARQIKKFSARATNSKPSPFDVLPEMDWTPEDIAHSIHFSSLADVQRRRTQLIQNIWGRTTLPTDTRFASRQMRIEDPLQHTMPNGYQANSYVVVMPLGIKSTVLQYAPSRRSGNLAVVYGSHLPSLHHAKLVEAFGRLGYEVWYLDPPLLGLNYDANAWADVPGRGKLRLSGDHQIFQVIEEASEVNPILYFVHPVLAVLNQAMSSRTYDHVIMVGISGGGWASTLYPALDARITESFPIAGALPLFLRAFILPSYGDYEQTGARLYNDVNYLELMVMASAEHGRRQLQVLNQYDQTAFPGILGQFYGDIVTDRVALLGNPGGYELFIDSSHVDHDVSSSALKRIVDVIAGSASVSHDAIER